MKYWSHAGDVGDLLKNAITTIIADSKIVALNAHGEENLELLAA